MVIGVSQGLALPMEGALPPDLQGTLFRVGPARAGTRRAWARGSGGAAAPGGDGGGDGPVSGPRGALHAVELRDGKAVSYVRRESDADAGVFWHAGSVLALPEAGLPSQYSRFLEPEDFAGGLTVPIASHVHRVAADGARVLFAVDDGVDRVSASKSVSEGAEAGGGGESASDGIWLRIGEWDAAGGLRTAQSVELERATWQHDIGVTANHIVFIESPTARLAQADAAEAEADADSDSDADAEGSGSAVPFRWVPGAEGWMGVVRRGGGGGGVGWGGGGGGSGAGGDGWGDGGGDGAVRWFRLDPCLVTHVLGASEVGVASDGVEGIVLYVCRYAAPEAGQPVDLSASVVAAPGIGLSTIGGGLATLERWRIVGDRVERAQLDDRHVEYPRIDAMCEGAHFRYGYCVEMSWGDESGSDVSPGGLLRFDLDRDEVAAWNPGAGGRPSEPVFVRATDGHGDDEGWLLTVVDDAHRGASDLYVLDASSLGRRGPEAVIHLPERLPVRSHGEWVPADRYR